MRENELQRNFSCFSLSLSLENIPWTLIIYSIEYPFLQITYEQRHGPYTSFTHVHRLLAEGEGTRVEDVVEYRLPGGPLGAALLHAPVSLWLRYIFPPEASSTKE